jgi:hypothetical protein
MLKVSSTNRVQAIDGAHEESRQRRQSLRYVHGASHIICKTLIRMRSGLHPRKGKDEIGAALSMRLDSGGITQFSFSGAVSILQSCLIRRKCFLRFGGR